MSERDEAKPEGQVTDTKALREMLAKATPGEWRASDDQPDDVVIWSGPRGVGIHVANLGGPVEPVGADDPQWRRDAEAIVALHNAAPALLDEVEALRAEVADLRMTPGGLDKWQGVISAYVAQAREAAFRDGAEAMREAAAAWCDITCPTNREANAIRTLPLPEDK